MGSSRRRRRARALDGRIRQLRERRGPAEGEPVDPITARVRELTGRRSLKDPEARTPEVLADPEIRGHARRALDSIMGGEKR